MFVCLIKSRQKKNSFPSEEHQIQPSKKEQCMMGMFGVRVNIANAFDGMKNYILVFTLQQRCFVICTDTHVH